MFFIQNVRIRIDWGIILIELLAILLLIVIVPIILIVLEKKVYKQFFLKNYMYVFKHRKVLLVNKRNKSLQDVYIMLAISCFELKKETEFSFFLDKVKDTHYECKVLFLQCLYCYFNNREKDFNLFFTKMKDCLDCEQKEKYVKLVELLLKKKNHEQISNEEKNLIMQVNSKTLQEYFFANK